MGGSENFKPEAEPPEKSESKKRRLGQGWHAENNQGIKGKECENNQPGPRSCCRIPLQAGRILVNSGRTSKTEESGHGNADAEKGKGCLQKGKEDKTQVQ